jgi:hypothetical protein
VLEFFFFMLILLGFIAGSGLIFILVNRLSGRLRPGGEDLRFSMLREELDSLSVRLGRMEEELEFYKQLEVPRTGEAPPGLPGPGNEDS